MWTKRLIFCHKTEIINLRVRLWVIMENLAEASQSFQISIVGSEGCGKTSFIRSLLSKGERKAADDENISRSNGIGGACNSAAFFHGVIIKPSDNISVNLVICDVCCSKRYLPLLSCWWRNSLATMVLFDVTSEESFEFGKKMVLQALEQRTSLVIMMVGTKADLTEDRKISADQVRAFTNFHEILFMEVRRNSHMFNVFMNNEKRFHL